MKILFLGDIVGRAAREAVIDELPALRRDMDIDFVVVNGENAAGGFGITETIANSLFDAGADVITLGNHAWDQRETLTHIDREQRLLRPANFPANTPGKGAGLFTTEKGEQVLIITVQASCLWKRWKTRLLLLKESLLLVHLGKPPML